jgi:glycerol transport system ATP-binding protein
VTLVLDHVSRAMAGVTLVDDVSLTLPRRSLNVLLGPTLAGKTSLLRLMAGLDAPTSGRLRFDGTDVTGVPVRKRSVAMVYQQFINYPNLSVFENIASPLRVGRISRAEIERRVREVATLLKLTPYLDRSPLHLSGGQQQRTALARALVKGADLVLLDEPLANLDYKLREELREELPKIFEASGAIFVYATTEPTEALLLGGNTATMWEGRVTQFGPTAHVYRRPPDLRTAALFSDPPLNVLPVDKRGGNLVLATGGIVAAPEALLGLPDGPYTIGFRAHHLFLSKPSTAAIAITGSVALTEITGSESYIHADLGVVRLVALVRGVHEIEPGTTTEFFIDPRSLFAFEPSGRVVVTPDPASAG